MDFQAEYRSKLRTPAEAVRAVKNGDWVDYTSGLGFPPLLDAALAAQRAGQRLRQLTQADAALRRAPRNKTARWLVGDAMVGAGDLRGCTYLRQSGLPAARKRADAAACP